MEPLFNTLGFGFDGSKHTHELRKGVPGEFFLCGFGAPFGFLGPEGPGRGPGGGSFLST